MRLDLWAAMACVAAVIAGPWGTAPVRAGEPPEYGRWAALVVAGDWRAASGNPTAAFENARRDVARALIALGFAPAHVVQMSVRPPDDETGVAFVAGPGALERELTRLKLRAPAGCFLYFTSHGSEQGLTLDEQLLTVSQMRQFVRATCGARPTILIISACHSGIFARGDLATPNRMIVTAALPERPSFGCGEGNQYPYFDECFITNVPQATDFIDLAERTRACVGEKEAALGLPPSQPQIVIGTEIGPALRAGRFQPD